MDELQISGKRYISSRRAAKDNGYHTDYIGQLIRGGKVKGQKVGRTWYVEASSFAAYLGQPEAAQVPQVVAEEAEVSQQPAPAPITAQPISAVPGYIPSAPLVAPTAHSTPVVATPKQEPIVTAPMQVEVPATPAPEPDTFSVAVRKIAQEPKATAGGLRYVASEPSIPEIARNYSAPRIVEETEMEMPAPYAPTAAVPAVRINPVRTLKLIGVVGVGIFAFSALVSSGLFQTINIEGGNPASIGYALHW